MKLELKNPWNAQDPESFFHSLLVYLILIAVSINFLNVGSKKDTSSKKETASEFKSKVIREIEWKFLSVFWLLRAALWMNGPYLYTALAAKKFDGEPASVALISKISLMQYIAIPIFAPLVGRFLDQHGFRLGTITGAVLYAIGGLSVCTNNSLFYLIVGRVLSGLGSSMMNNAPESWLVSMVGPHDPSGIWVGRILGKAFSFDSIIAIAAGKLAGYFAAQQGPMGPFQVAPVFLGIAAGLVLLFWKGEDCDPNRLQTEPTSRQEKHSTKSMMSQILELYHEIRRNPKLLFVGGVQCFFEASMYIFVMKWPPVLNAAVMSSFDSTSQTPYGTIFSCFMASCLVGSSILAKYSSTISLETSTMILLMTATLSMIFATLTMVATGTDGQVEASNNGSRKLWQLTIPFLVFEACVGLYFPSIGILRSRYKSTNNQSMMMIMVQVPLNMIVAVVFLFLHALGDARALGLMSAMLTLATSCMIRLLVLKKRDQSTAKQVEKFKKAVKKLVQAQIFLQGMQDTPKKKSLRFNNFNTFSSSFSMSPRASVQLEYTEVQE
mmetsp:Transcript_27321/g.40335  ORF Transcript_27321/g.40335 Transcript_27321/m.40335 type:complete len:552 (-) Transcript_27321:101-1756(-)|eukprot:CAMPEP_0194218354 /NCGR_PEP_ID=MMETSP0156-20130528/23589_1 /TAXON_ID=33649 /ORGANISM="Thalassionema nitzschioides, Strain L26-B" /LENGTH=551 /DNA_ID=CAMNT_0038947673 /DNA_START=59 /DNA_END=1714 /DNA_ORIENTATION=-